MTTRRNRIVQATPFAAGVVMWVLIDKDFLSGAPLLGAELVLFFSVVLMIWQGSNQLVKSSQDLAVHFHVSPFLIGLTIVAFGTGIPELVTSLVAGLGGMGGIAIANVVGSNILNISVILGGLALIIPGGLAIDTQATRLEAPLLMLGALLLMMFVGAAPVDSQIVESLKQLGLFNFQLERIEAIVLASGSVLYLIVINRKNMKNGHAVSSTVIRNRLSEQPTGPGEVKSENRNTILSSILGVLAGITVVIVGCHVLIGEANIVDGVTRGYGAVWFASILHVPDYLIGLTIVALGTSAPEIVVSLSAARTGSFDIGVGNLLGSAIFNLFAVLGITGLFVQAPVAEAMRIDADALSSLIAMGVLFVIVYIFMATRRRLSRTEGLILLCTGVAYLIYDVADSLARQSF